MCRRQGGFHSEAKLLNRLDGNEQQQASKKEIKKRKKIGETFERETEIVTKEAANPATSGRQFSEINATGAQGEIQAS